MNAYEILNEIKKICKESTEESTKYNPCLTCPFSSLISNDECIFDSAEYGIPSDWGEIVEKHSVIFK